MSIPERTKKEEEFQFVWNSGICYVISKIDFVKQSPEHVDVWDIRRKKRKSYRCNVFDMDTTLKEIFHLFSKSP